MEIHVAALDQFGFGSKFMNILEILYAGPQSSVLTNHDRSPHSHCTTAPGRAAGLPLSYASALALEPLAIANRSNPQISGIRCGTSECTIGLYADDVILTLSDVKTSLTPLLNLIDGFGQFSGFTINWEKSVIMPLSKTSFFLNLPFRVTHDRFSYLGINIPRNPKLLFKLNYGSICRYR